MILILLYIFSSIESVYIFFFFFSIQALFFCLIFNTIFMPLNSLKIYFSAAEYFMCNIPYKCIFVSVFSYLLSQWTSLQINLCSYLINFG